MIPIEGDRTYPFHRRFSQIIIPFTLFTLLLLAIAYIPATFSAHASLIDREQRERIREIDRELRDLKKKGTPGRVVPAAHLKGIRYFSNRKYARIVLDLSKVPDYKLDRKTGKVMVSLKGTGLQVPARECTVKAEKGILSCVTASRKGGGVSVEIALSGPARSEIFSLHGPDRLVVDLFRTDGKGKDEKKEKAVTITGNKASPPGRIVVVIDPGHGGKDPGAIGPRGRKEKDIVLRIALKLRNYLKKDKSFKIYMTRMRDTFIPLEKRSAIANGVGAHIFISLHANASRRRSARGISSFILGKKATDREALELAMIENGVVIKNDRKVNYILRDMINYGKGRESLKLAKVINDSIISKVKRRRKKVINLGVKKAPFYVLFGAAMPAVLVEASFITNPYGERYLSSGWYQEAIARSIYDGLKKYVNISKMAYYGKTYR